MSTTIKNGIFSVCAPPPPLPPPPPPQLQSTCHYIVNYYLKHGTCVWAGGGGGLEPSSWESLNVLPCACFRLLEGFSEPDWKLVCSDSCRQSYLYCHRQKVPIFRLLRIQKLLRVLRAVESPYVQTIKRSGPKFRPFMFILSCIPN